MKKDFKKPWIVFYLISAAFYAVSVFNFIDKDSSQAVIWMCLGSTFLCLGSVELSKKKKSDGRDDADDNSKN